MKRKVLTAILAIVLILALSAVSAFAVEPQDPEHPKSLPHGTKEEASVSKELDTADEKDASMGTGMYMWLEPDPEIHTHEDSPRMGDTGIDVKTLFVIALAAGAAYVLFRRLSIEEPHTAAHC